MSVIGCGLAVFFHMAALGVAAIVLLLCGVRALWRPAEETRWAQCGLGVAALGGLFVAWPMMEIAFPIWALVFVVLVASMVRAKTRPQVLRVSGAFIAGELLAVVVALPAILTEARHLCVNHPDSCLLHATSGYAAGSCSQVGVGYFYGLAFTGLVAAFQLVVVGANLVMTRLEGR